MHAACRKCLYTSTRDITQKTSPRRVLEPTVELRPMKGAEQACPQAKLAHLALAKDQ